LNKRDPLLAEVDFFDARRKASTLDQFLRIPARYIFAAPFGLQTMLLPRTGAVIRPDDGEFQTALEKQSARQCALDPAAGGLGQRSRPDEDNAEVLVAKARQ
jgi:hypothetical protein